MPSILDASVLIGAETTYGTPATLTRAYEAQADAWKRTQEALESVGFRAGMQTVRSDRRRQINMGAEGEITLDVLDRGMGLLLGSLLGAVPSPSLVTSGVYTLTLTTDTVGPAASYTVQVQRVTPDGTVTPFTYHGAVFTGFDLEQAVGGFLKATLRYTAEDEDTVTAAGTPAYPTGATPFDWTQAVVSVNGTPLDVESFKVSGDLGMKTDRRFLRGSPLKRVPRRSQVPSFTGELVADFTGLTDHGLWVAGTVFPIEATWAGALITGAHYHSLTVTAPACQYDGATPEASLDDLTKATLPFKVLHNGTNPALTITLKSADAAL